VLADTLILDEDGVYDQTNFNERLLLNSLWTQCPPAAPHDNNGLQKSLE